MRPPAPVTRCHGSFAALPDSRNTVPTRRARLVGTVLRESGSAAKLPWHRVTGAGGRIAFAAGSSQAREQLSRLAREGVEIRGNGVRVKRTAATARSLDALLWKF